MNSSSESNTEVGKSGQGLKKQQFNWLKKKKWGKWDPGQKRDIKYFEQESDRICISHQVMLRGGVEHGLEGESGCKEVKSERIPRMGWGFPVCLFT